MNEVEKFYPLHMTLYGKTLSQAIKVMKEIAETNNKDVGLCEIRPNGGFIIFTDGSTLSCSSEDCTTQLLGTKYDQAFLTSNAMPNDNLYESLASSCVPSGYKIQRLD